MAKFCIGLFWLGIGFLYNPIISGSTYPEGVIGVALGAAFVLLSVAIRVVYEISKDDAT